MTGALIHINMGGPHLNIAAKGRVYRFEMHPYCGPALLDRHGDPRDRQPGEKSPFWKAVQWWLAQGERVVGEECMYDVPAPEKVIRLSARRCCLDTPRSRESFADAIAIAKKYGYGQSEERSPW